MQTATEKSPRYAIVTGGGNGLGRAIAVCLANDGWCVAISDIDEAASRETLAMVKADGGSGRVERLDVRSPDEWQSLIERLQAEWPRLDMLVNNAGVCCSGAVGAVPLENWRWLLDVNLFGAIHGCHASLGWLKQNPRRASLVNISSIAALLAAPGMGTYNVSKAGVVALSETLAAELVGSNVRVTVACPGFFRSKLLECGRFLNAAERDVAERYTTSAPMTCEQIADRIVRAAYRGKLYAVMPARARWVWYLRRMFPSLWIRFVGGGYRRMLDAESQNRKAR